MNAPLAPRASTVEIEDVATFDALVDQGAKSMRGWHFQAIDLRHRTEKLVMLKANGAVFLGCSFAPEIEDLLRSRGALVFPRLPDIPFNPYRGHLYTGGELYKGIATKDYEATLDAKVYQWTLQPGQNKELNATMATAMHDHAISDALDEFTDECAAAGTKIVGVMGGHAGERGSEDYRQAALLGSALARAGFMVATGGGPGSMEAANLGAYLSTYDDGALDTALTLLAAVPSFKPSITDWGRCADAVLKEFPQGAANLGIPTWFYGHEPPNTFATSIAKYFANSIREAVLLARCDGGIIFLPGAAGTVQEVFQDACENYYAAEGAGAPMILVGQRHWTQDLPVWPLLQALAAGRGMESNIHLVDSVEAAVVLLKR